MVVKTRFDLEQDIHDCWNITKDIDTLLVGVVEQDLTRDQIANILLGMQELYSLKFDRLFTTFEEMIKDKEIR